MADDFKKLQQRFAQTGALQSAAAVLSWDQETYMPPAGAAARARHRAVLARMAHELFTADETGQLLERLEARLDGEGRLDGPEEDGFTPEERGLYVRYGKEQFERSRKLPASFVQRQAAAAAAATDAWRRAREADEWPTFRPHLEELVQLTLERAELLGYKDDRYDALLDLYEPDMPTSAVEAEFDKLRRRLVPLVEAVMEAAPPEDGFLRQPFDEDVQWAVGMEALRRIGFDFERGRQDRSAHPFTTSFSSNDVRITTRIGKEDFPSGLFATLHEAGHGFHAMGIPDRLRETPLTGYRSLGIGESQSLLWENVVGRSRAFWEHFWPEVQRRFPAQLGNVTLDAFYRAINKVERSLIRVDADELTYNLHIFVRFDLERQLVAEKLAVKDLPEAWNELMKETVGVVPDSDTNGVLQDIHWSQGAFGYFPTYTLGNVLSVQFYEQAVSERPSIPEEIRQGKFDTLLEWTRDAIHRHGGMYKPMELVERVTGRGLDSEPYLRYLETKYQEIYRL